MNKEIIYFYLGFPKSWTNFKESKKYEILLQNLKSIDVISEDLAKFIIYKNYDKANIKGIDFGKLFSQIIDDPTFLLDFELKDINIVYNIGTELANSKSFAGQILNQLINRAQQFNKKFYLTGASKTTLKKEYQLFL